MDNEIKLFNDYYSKFDDSIDAIHRKYEHTFRVVGYAERVAKSLNLSAEDINLAKVCALFHDIGRFPQWTEYQTFVDSDSFDHGEKSYEILKELGYDNKIVQIAVRYHNKYKIPNDLNEREELFANITRDADKIDIIFTQGLKVDDEEFILSSKAVNQIKNEELIKNDSSTYNDVFILMRMMSFIFDMNFLESFKIIKKNDLLNKKLNLISNKFGEDKVKEIRKKFNDYLNERISE